MMLRADGLTKRYGEFLALDGVSLTLGEGEFVSIIGPNGAGKTTLVNVLTGLSTPTSGRVSFKGVDVTGLGPVRLARMGLARSFQLVSVFPALTVAETLAVPIVSRRRLGVKAIVQVEHDMDIVFGYSDRIVALHQGRVLADTTPDGIQRDAEVVATVLGKPRA